MKISQKNRKIGYTYSSVSGNFSFRGEKTISFESTLERDLLTSLEFDESVSDVIEQPVTIEYVNANGNNTTYTPDFLVHYRTISTEYSVKEQHSRLIEVKPNFILKKKWKTLKPKFKIGVAYAKQQGYTFHIYDESRLHSVCFGNIKFLSKYKRYHYSTDENMRILDYMNLVGHTPIDHLALSISPEKEKQGITLAHVWYLLSIKKLGCNMQEPLSNKTVIWSNSEKMSNLL
jgi:hypothetical protein